MGPTFLLLLSTFSFQLSTVCFLSTFNLGLTILLGIDYIYTTKTTEPSDLIGQLFFYLPVIGGWIRNCNAPPP